MSTLARLVFHLASVQWLPRAALAFACRVGLPTGWHKKTPRPERGAGFFSRFVRSADQMPAAPSLSPRRRRSADNTTERTAALAATVNEAFAEIVYMRQMILHAVNIVNVTDVNLTQQSVRVAHVSCGTQNRGRDPYLKKKIISI